MAARLWLLEGLPGTGKTTAAERLCDLCEASGTPARWWLEEARDHPATPASLRRRADAPDFGEVCALAFRDFVEREPGVLILEGSAFQSVVRFMFANGWPARRIRDYLANWSAAVSDARPRLLIFAVTDPYRHFEDLVVNVRGPTWIARLTAYVEQTPIAAANDWSGFDGFVRFWAGYQQLVLELAGELKCPSRVVEGWPQSRRFDAFEALDFFES